MTTSPSTADLPAAALPPGGMPDIAVLERMVNQLFRDVTGPQTTALPGVPGLLREPPRAPSAIPALPGIPGETELRALLGGTAGPTAAPLAFTHAANPQDFYFLGGGLPTGVPSVPASSAAVVPPVAFPAERIRQEFPILAERVHGGRRLVWLDNAATTQKPRTVIERISRYYERENSNIHRAAHVLAARATDAYEGARESVRRFLNAASSDEIVFVRGATEGINLVAQTWAKANLRAGDEVLVSHLEHHANIVPWQQVTAETGATLRVIPVDDRGALDLDAYARLLNPKVKLVSITQVANAIGTVVPVQRVVELAHAAGARVLVDGAQSVSHMPVDVRALGADWFVFSGHKVFAPTGIGAVYGRKELLDAAPPYQRGGNMIADVTFERTVFHDAPMRYEAGTGSIADAVGLGAALDWLMAIGLDRVAAYEHQLIAYANARLRPVRGLRIIGEPPERAGVLSFVLDGYTTQEVGQALDKDGIAVRSGHHCAQPILRRFGLESSVRPSFALYNTCQDIDALVATVDRLAGARRP
jgi:cysteine desulfurase/selenocysteine lyase